MALKIIILAAFALMTIIVGIIASRKARSFSDFFLGGNDIGPWMTAFTYGAAYFSAVLFIGFAGKIGWDFGMSGLWIALGNSFIGVLGVWWILGPKIKKMSTDWDVQTMAEYFEKRYNSKALNIYTSICIFIFFIPYTAAVFMGLSYLFKANFNVEYTTALAFMGIFTAVYLVMGGYRSMTMIDVIFGIIMIAGVITLFFSTVSSGGGLDKIFAGLASVNPKLTSTVGPPGIWPLFCLVFLTSVAPFAMPQLVQKFYAIKDQRSIRIGMVASTIFSILIAGVAYFTGATARLFISPENAPAAFKNGKPVFDALVPEFLAKAVPEGLSILILLLVISASMSTLAALVLISSSTVSKDVYHRFINNKASDKRLTIMMRVCSAFFVLLSVIMAYFKPATIVSILGISWGSIGAAFLGPFVWGLLSKRTTKFAAFTSSVLGLATCLILYVKGISPPEAGTIGMLISLGVCPAISLFSPAKEQVFVESNINR
ncbi:MAG TPA: sodium:solute symporter [candidate division Zixibacteria bacterium]|nr:sodium:solute symporter [candidate division Zixibacteria bacterium]